jgi:transposase
MSNRIFNKEQVETLLQNPNVTGCSEKSISYRKDFKVLAVRKYQEGLPPSEIFRQARFDIGIIGRKTPNRCLRRWKKVFRDKGLAGLKTDGRGQNKAGGRPKGLTGLSDEEKLKRLKAEVAYLKEENRFLAKLRKESLN